MQLKTMLRPACRALSSGSSSVYEAYRSAAHAAVQVRCSIPLLFVVFFSLSFFCPLFMEVSIRQLIYLLLLLCGLKCCCIVLVFVCSLVLGWSFQQQRDCKLKKIWESALRYVYTHRKKAAVCFFQHPNTPKAASVLVRLATTDRVPWPCVCGLLAAASSDNAASLSVASMFEPVGCLPPEPLLLSHFA